MPKFRSFICIFTFKQVKSGGIHPAGPPPIDRKAEKEKKAKEAKELADLFKPVIIQKIDKGKVFSLVKDGIN